MIKAGEKLKEIRIEKGLSLEDVSKATKIKESFLDYIERGEYQKLPSVSYAQGFVRNYVKFLGLSEREIMAIFRREFDEEKTYRVLPKGFEKTEEFSITGFKIRQTFVLIGGIIVLFLFYLLFQYRYAFINPPLTIISPKDNSQITSSQVKISGITDSNAAVYVNKNLVSVDSRGNFEKTVSVFPGKSVITIKAINKFSRETTKQIQIDVKGGS
jgi:cytoskeletal protein RodZ